LDKEADKIKARRLPRFEALIPDELARGVDVENGSLVRYIAECYLRRAVSDDAAETLYVMELKREVAALPAARSLSDREVDALIRMITLVWIV
jgi:hypothetical protein